MTFDAVNDFLRGETMEHDNDQTLRRFPVTDAIRSFQRCTVNYYGDDKHEQQAANWLITASVKAAASPFVEAVNGSWYACDFCWQQLVGRGGWNVAPDGVAGLLAAVHAPAVDDDQADRVDADQMLTWSMEAVATLGKSVAAFADLYRAAKTSREQLVDMLSAALDERDELRGVRRRLSTTIAHGEEQQRVVYRERAALVALLAAQLGAWWDTASITTEYRAVVMDGPEGQLSWHIATQDLDLFEHVTATDTAPYDGHTIAQKYNRIAQMVSTLAERNRTGGGIYQTGEIPPLRRPAAHPNGGHYSDPGKAAEDHAAYPELDQVDTYDRDDA